MTDPTVSIAITTLNRESDLKETLLALTKLDPAPLEILVCLDGCTDKSRETLAEFAQVRVIEHERPRGSVVSRDELFRKAKGDLIVSLDDDSHPVQPDFVLRLQALAIDHPEAGVFSFQEIRPEGRDDRPFGTHKSISFVASYANCAGAIRSSLYGKSASYPHAFFHMYEEPDFCLQIYANGYGVLFSPSIQILHRYTHVGRNMIGRHHLHARNELWSVLMRCPMPYALWVCAYRIGRQFVFAASMGWRFLINEPRWWLEAVSNVRKPLAQRRPVAWCVYWQWMRLGRNPLPADPEILRKTFLVSKE